MQPLRAEDVADLSWQPAQSHEGAVARLLASLPTDARAWTAWDGKTCLGVGGYAEHWPGRIGLWAFLSEDAGPRMVGLTRIVASNLDRLRDTRIEATTVTTFAPGHRWLRLLGFEREGTMRRYAHGLDYDLYARVNG